MLTQREKDFIQYWEANRLRRKKIVRQFLIGIPIGLLFAIPITINFASGWDKRAQMEANSQDFNPLVLLIALLSIVGFTAIFYQRHQWEQYEQRYHELLSRKDPPPPTSPGPKTPSDHPSASPDSAPGASSASPPGAPPDPAPGHPDPGPDGFPPDQAPMT
ncbi:MAG TPA: hypothetical protein VNW04_22020 [Puia sp.]|nr:hypothetical protein [Puia sp.]